MKKNNKISGWSKYDSLYLYANTEKINDLTARFFGEIKENINTLKSTNKKIGLNVKASFLKMFGIGDIGGSMDTDYSVGSGKTITSTVGFEQKLNAIVNYLQENDGLLYIDCDKGLNLKPNAETDFTKWETEEFNMTKGLSKVGFVYGSFNYSRLFPNEPSNERKSHLLIGDIFHGNESLWQFHTIENAKIDCTVPVDSAFFRKANAQILLCILESNLHDGKETVFEAFGLINEKNGKLNVNPITLRTFDK